jgi:hypothetical protein
MDSYTGSIVAAQHVKELIAQADASRALSAAKRARRNAPKPPGARRRLLGRFARAQRAS